MEISLYFKGILIGLAIAAPIGPVNLIIVTRTLNMGRRLGWISGFGAVVTDLIYGSIASFGLTLLSDILLSHQVVFRVLGGLALIALGTRTGLRNAGRDFVKDKEPTRLAYASAFGSVFLINLLNPMTIMTWLAVITGLGLTGTALTGAAGPMTIVFGVLTGTLSWITFLVLAAHWLLNRMHERWLRGLNIAAGVGLVFFGAAAAISAL
jgi:threonine/homoserine/homoserine lactone efflux protein